ncbi:MAG TPA: hypothetical protein ENJ56_06905 [Anaerolineae bacterium]|nr:hypothetical protein [Anaerolineae bacterium]
MRAIVAAIAENVTVTTYVHNFEALSVYKHSKVVTPDDKERVDLSPLIKEGLIQLVDFQTPHEELQFLEFLGKRLDDGEAISLAIATNRNWAIATDDKAARRVCKKEFSSIQQLSTAELLKHWVEHQTPTNEQIRDTLTFIELRANYLISPRDPLFGWWRSFF